MRRVADLGTFALVYSEGDAADRLVIFGDRAENPRHQGGGPNYRLLQCQRCRAVFHRDRVGAANIGSMGWCLLRSGLQLWGENWMGPGGKKLAEAKNP
jgi:hypothetical protein